MTVRTIRFLTVLLLLVTGSAVTTAAASADGDVFGEYFEEYVTSLDGTSLWAQVWRPAGVERDERTPVVVVMTPYAAASGVITGNVEPGAAEAFLAQGWTLAVVSLRGFGQSGGCSELRGPGEQMDAVAIIEWADSAPWSNGRVGAYGLSYDGATPLMAIAGGAPLDAAVIIAGPTSVYSALYDNGVHYGADWRGLAFFYAFLQLFAITPVPGVGNFPTPWLAEDPLDTVPHCYLNAQAADLLEDDRDARFWAEREYGARVAGTDVPILWSQGFADTQVKPDQFLPVWSTLTGDSHGVFGQAGHNFGTRADRITQTVAFLAHHLEDVPARDEPVVKVQDNDGRWRGEEAWPPADAEPYTFALRSGSYLDRPGSSYADVDHAAALWTFTAPLSSDSHIAGAGNVTVDVDIDQRIDEPRMVVSVYDVAPDDTATLITRGAKLLRGDGVAAIDLYPQDWIVRAGHRLGVAVTGSDEAWYERGVSVAPVIVRHAEVTLPLLTWSRNRFIDDGVPHGTITARPATVPGGLVVTRTLPIDLPGTTTHPCTAAPTPAACPPWLRGAPPAEGEVVRLVDTEVQLGPGRTLGLIQMYPVITVPIEVPEAAGTRDLTVHVDPDRLTGMYLGLRDDTGATVGFDNGSDLWRHGIVFPEVEPGTYHLAIYNNGPALENAFGAELLPIVRVTAVLHTD